MCTGRTGPWPRTDTNRRAGRSCGYPPSLRASLAPAAASALRVRFFPAFPVHAHGERAALSLLPPTTRPPLVSPLRQQVWFSKRSYLAQSAKSLLRLIGFGGR